MPTAVSRVPAAARRANAALGPAPRDPDVVAIHRTREDPIGRRVEAIDELATLMVEVADDRWPAVGLDAAPEALVEIGLAAIGGHGQLARERKPVEAETIDELDLEVVPGDGHRPGRGGSRDRHHRVARRAAARGRPRARPSRPAIRRRPGRAGRCRVRRGGATGHVPGRASKRSGRRVRTDGRSAGRSMSVRSCHSGRRAGSRPARRRASCRVPGPGR